MQETGRGQDQQGEPQPPPDDPLPGGQTHGRAQDPRRDSGPPLARTRLKDLPEGELQRRLATLRRVVEIAAERDPRAAEGANLGIGRIEAVLRQRTHDRHEALTARMDGTLERREGWLEMLRAGVPAEMVEWHFRIPRGLMGSLVERVAAEPADRPGSGERNPDYGEAVTRILTGDSLDRIAKDLHMDNETVVRIKQEIVVLRGDPPRTKGKQPHPRRPEALRRLSAGQFPEQVANDLDVLKPTVKQWANMLRAQGVAPPRPRGRQPHPRRAEGIEQFRAGRTISQVAAKFGVPLSTAASWRRQLNKQKDEGP